jgi:hypothetical protein
MTFYFLAWILRVRLFLAWLCLRAALWYLKRAGRVVWRFDGRVNNHVLSTATVIFDQAGILRLAWDKEWTSPEPSAAEVKTFSP